jgi:cytochrome oxidase Cu insertion factor (SCO1/SenC/PrrC family)
MEDRLTHAPRLGRDEAWALAGLLVTVAVTLAWWALALWPTGPNAPNWLARTQAVCFGVRSNGLPDAAGWIGLIGSPLGMLAMLLAAGRTAFRRLRRQVFELRWLQLTVLAMVLVVVTSGFAAAARVRMLSAQAAGELIQNEFGSAVKTNHTAASLRLTDQFGGLRDLRDFNGRIVFVAFAYAHCETVCPVLVRQVVRAQRELRKHIQPAPAVLIVTLDPARDTPSRLPTIARSWELGSDAYVLSGTVEDVQRLLDNWKISRTYNPANGNVTHAAVAYLVNRKGRIEYETIAPSQELLVHLAQATH